MLIGRPQIRVAFSQGASRFRRRCCSRRSSGKATPEDAAGVLRRAAAFIEEDPALAKTLGSSLAPEAVQTLAARMKGLDCSVQEPTQKMLRRVVIANAIPFIGFGFMDNAIMITAGEYIDITLGVTLGISTMCAAALGNLISDLAGVGLGGVVENIARRLGMPDPGLSRAQQTLRSTRVASHLGCAIGVSVGCVLGMFPLLLAPAAGDIASMKRSEKLQGLIREVMKEAGGFLNASSATLFIRDSDTNTLWSKGPHPHDDTIQDITINMDGYEGPVGQVVREGTTVNRKEGTLKSMLCMPVYNPSMEVVAVVQVLDKKGGFTSGDESKLAALCSHISIVLENAKRADKACDEAEVDLAETIRLLKSHGTLTNVTF
ncbi:unnamed protein product [Chrysoparadoxa australica]